MKESQGIQSLLNQLLDAEKDLKAKSLCTYIYQILYLHEEVKETYMYLK